MLAELAFLATTCAPDIHPDTLKAVVKHESGYNQFAVGINKGKRLERQPRTKDEAVRIVKDLIARKVDFDGGLGQINVRNWDWLGLTPETVFDPCTNLRAAQAVLKDCYVRATKQFGGGQAALMAAFSCYNTGNFERGFRNGYVEKVLAAANIKVPAITSDSVQYLDGLQVAPGATKKPSPTKASSTVTEPKTSRTDAFANPRSDAFSERRPDVFGRRTAPRTAVGSIVYHPR